VTPRGIDVAELPADDVIDRAADDYRKELLSSRHKLAVSTLGPKLYQMLVAPAGTIAASSRVIILPDAHLRALSFDALIVPAKPPHYWIEDVTISYSPSLNLLASMPAWKSVHDPRALVFGDVPGEGLQFPKLKRAGREIGEIARHFGSRAVIRSGINATPAAYVAANPKQFQFIHFAAHSTAGTDRPMEESAVILARDAHGFSLSGKAIVLVPLEAELVTVSSCNSAGRRNFAGEGVVGLAWAFLRAGARRVVAAQWEVDDSAAPPMMNKMYAAIVAGGVEPAEALRQAKLGLLHSNTPHKQPLYWAPFAIYGAY
jgi:CHAT domain-containing protein